MKKRTNIVIAFISLAILLVIIIFLVFKYLNGSIDNKNNNSNGNNTHNNASISIEYGGYIFTFENKNNYNLDKDDSGENILILNSGDNRWSAVIHIYISPDLDIYSDTKKLIDGLTDNGYIVNDYKFSEISDRKALIIEYNHNERVGLITYIKTDSGDVFEAQIFDSNWEIDYDNVPEVIAMLNNAKKQ